MQILVGLFSNQRTLQNCLKYVPICGIFCGQLLFLLNHHQRDEYVSIQCPVLGSYVKHAYHD